MAAKGEATKRNLNNCKHPSARSESPYRSAIAGRATLRRVSYASQPTIFSIGNFPWLS